MSIGAQANAGLQAGITQVSKSKQFDIVRRRRQHDAAPGDRGFLAAALGAGMRAVTIRIDEIAGVGGFVTPGDRVDMVLTRDAGAIQEVEGVAQGAAGSTITTELVVQNAKVLAEELMNHGIRLVSGGTDNHLLLLDFSDMDITGLEAQELLDQAGITTNKNTVPGDKRPPKVTSGLRLGTPAMTTRGFGPPEMKEVGRIISEVVTTKPGSSRLAELRTQSLALTSAFPLYPSLDR